MGCDIHVWVEYRAHRTTLQDVILGPLAKPHWQLARDMPCPRCRLVYTTDGAGEFAAKGGPGRRSLEATRAAFNVYAQPVAGGTRAWWTQRVDARRRDCFICKGAGVDKQGRLWMNRDYDLFAMLAGVRNRNNRWPPPYIEPRGIPKDCSKEFRDKAEEPFYHSHSWLDMNDLTAMLLHEMDPQQERASEFIDTVLNPILLPMAEDFGYANVRIVFFFDS